MAGGNDETGLRGRAMVGGVFEECMALGQWCADMQKGGSRRPDMRTGAGYLRTLH